MKQFSLYVLALVTVCLLSMTDAGAADSTVYRGMNVAPSTGPAELQVLGQWKVNLVRWQLIWELNTGGPADRATPEQYDAWLEKTLKHLDEMLPVCQKYGIRVLVDLHTTPGGHTPDKQSRIFADAKAQARFLEVWKKLAKRYSGNKTVWGYDLANEPIQKTVASGLMKWPELAAKAAQAVRQFDPDHAIVVAPNDVFVGFVPLPPSISNVVYTFHMYQPWEFTSQGIGPDGATYRYPGPVGGRDWDKARLKRLLQPVLDFQRKYGARIYVGEFSAVRWAPGAYDWLKDVIDIFEENGWDWTYHAFREYHGWSVEHGEDKGNTAPAAKPTRRELLLKSYFSKNR